MAKGKYLYSIQVMVLKSDMIHYFYITDISRNQKQFIKYAKCIFSVHWIIPLGDISSLGPEAFVY